MWRVLWAIYQIPKKESIIKGLIKANVELFNENEALKKQITHLKEIPS